MSTQFAALLLLVVGAVVGFYPAFASVDVEDDFEQDDASEWVVLLQTTASYRIKTSKSGAAEVSVDMLDAQAFQFLAPRRAPLDRAKIAQVAASALPSNETDSRASSVSLQGGVEVSFDFCRLLAELPVLGIGDGDADDDAGVPIAVTCEDGLHVPLSLLQTSARYRLKQQEGLPRGAGMVAVGGWLPDGFGLPLAADAWEQAADEARPGAGGELGGDLGAEFLALPGPRGRGGEGGEGSTYLLQTSATYRLVRAEEGGDGSALILRQRGRSASRPTSRGLACEQRHLAWSQEGPVKVKISDESLDTVFDLLGEADAPQTGGRV